MSNRRTVLYLATFDPTVDSSGTTTRGKLFLNFLTEHFNVHLVHLRDKDSNEQDVTILSKLKSIKSINYSNLRYFIFCNSLLKSAENILSRAKVDVIFADFEKSGLYATMLKQKFKIPFIYSSHNVEYLRYIEFGRRNAIRYFLVPYMYLTERLACTEANFVITISSKDAKSFKQWVHREKLKIFPCAFDSNLFKPFDDTSQPKQPTVLMVGNYRNPGNRQGAYILSEKIVPKVIRKRPDVIFRCVGNNFPTDIQHPNIEAVGFVQDLIEEYKKATAVIAPIKIGGGIKIKVIEALACGKLLISTLKGLEGIDYSNLENVKAAKIDEFANHILEAVRNPVTPTTSNWEEISCSYGIESNLFEIKQIVENATL